MTVTTLISGGAGFIGTALARKLTDGNDGRVVLLDNLHPQVHKTASWPNLESDSVIRVRGDVTDVGAWNEALDASTSDLRIVHLAAETGTGQSLTEARRHASVNVVGTAALTDALSARSIRPLALILCSSRAVYGEGMWTAQQGERTYAEPRLPEQLERQDWAPRAAGVALDAPLAQRAAFVEPRPTNVYAATKLAQEHALAAWAQAMDVALVVLRLQNVYGAGQALENSYTGVLTYFARQLLRGDGITVYEGGGIIRDFVHVDDVVQALINSVAHGTSGVVRFDIGSGEPRTLLQVAQLMSSIAGGPAPTVTNDFRLGDVRAAFADISDARNALHYSPSVSLEQGLAGLLEYARTEHTGAR